MSRKVGTPAAVGTAKLAPRGRDVLAMGAALAHADAERGMKDREAMQRYGTSRRSHSRWRTEGPPPVRDVAGYLLACSDPYRVEAYLRSVIKMRALSRLSDADLILRYHELLAHEPRVEAEDRIDDVTRGVCWLQRAAVSERDSAIDAEKAACEREFAARGLSESDVFGKGPGH